MNRGRPGWLGMIDKPHHAVAVSEGWGYVYFGPPTSGSEQLPNGGTITPRPGDKYCLTSMCHVDARAFVGSLS